MKKGAVGALFVRERLSQRRRRTTTLDDLDAAVLRLSDAIRRRYAKIVLTAPGDHESVMWHPVLHQHGGYSIGPPHGQSLVVVGRARGVGKPSDLNGYGGAGSEPVSSQLDDLSPARTDNGAVPVKEDQVHRRWRRGGGGGGMAQAATVSIKQSKNSVSSVPPTVEQRSLREIHRAHQSAEFNRPLHLGCSHR